MTKLEEIVEREASASILAACSCRHSGAGIKRGWHLSGCPADKEHLAVTRTACRAVAKAVIEECSKLGDELKIRRAIVGNHQPSKWRNSAIEMFKEQIRALLGKDSE